MPLKDKVAVITGGANGIGRETAILFGRNGAKVVVADFDEPKGMAVQQELERLDVESAFVRTDVTRPDDVQAMVDTARGQFGTVDVLINNAGIVRDSFLVKMNPSQWEEVISVNLTGVFYCSRAVAEIMVNQGSGIILNAASVVGLYGNIGQTNYAAAKAGVIGMTRTWAKELGPKGIRVNAVAPGFILTDMTRQVPEKVLDSMRQRTPLRRLGRPEDVANAYLFLASDEAAFINGAVLSVDGGLMI